MPKVTLSPILIPILLFFAIAIPTTNFDVHNKYGDAQSFMNVMYSAKKMAKDGFIAERFKPSFLVDRNDNCCQEIAYTHFPPLTSYFSTLLWKAGLTQLYQHKAFILFAGLLLIVGYYLFIQGLLGTPFAVISSVILILQPYFHRLAITQYYFWADCFFVLSMLFTSLYIRTSNRRYFWCSWVMFLLCSYSSFEYILSCQIATTLLLFFFKRDSWFRDSFVYGWAAISAMAFHFATNIWRLGSWDAAIIDLKTAFIRRTVDGLNENFVDRFIGGYKNYPLWLLKKFSSKFYFNIISSAIVLFGLFKLAQTKKSKNEIIRFTQVAGAVSLANLSLWAAFPQLTVIQITSVVGRGGPIFASLILGGLIYFAGKHLRLEELRSDKTSTILLKLVIFVLAVAPLGFLGAGLKNQIAHSETLTYASEKEVLHSIQPTVSQSEDLPVLFCSKLIFKASYLHRPISSFDLFNNKTAYIQKNSPVEQLCGNECFLVKTNHKKFEACDPELDLESMFALEELPGNNSDNKFSITIFKLTPRSEQ